VDAAVVREASGQELARLVTIGVDYDSVDYPGYVGRAEFEVWIPITVTEWSAIEAAAIREVRKLLNQAGAAFDRRA
jgi:hypothetical protein